MNDWHLLYANTPKDRTLLGRDMAEEYLPFLMIWDATQWMEQAAL
ncbi:hypothetical protein [Tardiphaga sp. 37S4]|nr:hypothetical protein [Tardiphaga sp. 37S4]